MPRSFTWGLSRRKHFDMRTYMNYVAVILFFCINYWFFIFEKMLRQFWTVVKICYVSFIKIRKTSIFSNIHCFNFSSQIQNWIKHCYNLKYFFIYHLWTTPIQESCLEKTVIQGRGNVTGVLRLHSRSRWSSCWLRPPAYWDKFLAAGCCNTFHWWSCCHHHHPPLGEVIVTTRWSLRFTFVKGDRM